MARDTVKLDAPYVYLSNLQNGADQYLLFILVEVKADTRVIFNNNVSYPSRIALIEYEIEDFGGGAAGIFPHCIQLNPAQNLATGLTFNAQQFSAEVKTSRTIGTGPTAVITKRTVNIFYEHSGSPTDGFDAAFHDQTAKTAYECPYLYQTMPDAAVGIQSKFDPYCMVQLKDFGAATPENRINRGGGVHTQRIELVAQTGNTAPIPPGNIDSNTKSNTDTARTGYFEAEVVIPTTQTTPLKRKKGRLEDASSDSNPNSFIDKNPFYL